MGKNNTGEGLYEACVENGCNKILKLVPKQTGGFDEALEYVPERCKCKNIVDICEWLTDLPDYDVVRINSKNGEVLTIDLRNTIIKSKNIELEVGRNDEEDGYFNVMEGISEGVLSEFRCKQANVIVVYQDKSFPGRVRMMEGESTLEVKVHMLSYKNSYTGITSAVSCEFIIKDKELKNALHSEEWLSGKKSVRPFKFNKLSVEMEKIIGENNVKFSNCVTKYDFKHWDSDIHGRMEIEATYTLPEIILSEGLVGIFKDEIHVLAIIFTRTFYIGTTIPNSLVGGIGDGKRMMGQVIDVHDITEVEKVFTIVQRHKTDGIPCYVVVTTDTWVVYTSRAHKDSDGNTKNKSILYAIGRGEFEFIYDTETLVYYAEMMCSGKVVIHHPMYSTMTGPISSVLQAIRWEKTHLGHIIGKIDDYSKELISTCNESRGSEARDGVIYLSMCGLGFRVKRVVSIDHSHVMSSDGKALGLFTEEESVVEKIKTLTIQGPPMKLDKVLKKCSIIVLNYAQDIDNKGYSGIAVDAKTIFMEGESMSIYSQISASKGLRKMVYIDGRKERTKPNTFIGHTQAMSTIMGKNNCMVYSIVVQASKIYRHALRRWVYNQSKSLIIDLGCGGRPNLSIARECNLTYIGIDLIMPVHDADLCRRFTFLEQCDFKKVVKAARGRNKKYMNYVMVCDGDTIEEDLKEVRDAIIISEFGFSYFEKMIRRLCVHYSANIRQEASVCLTMMLMHNKRFSEEIVPEVDKIIAGKRNGSMSWEMNKDLKLTVRSYEKVLYEEPWYSSKFDGFKDVALNRDESEGIKELVKAECVHYGGSMGQSFVDRIVAKHY